MSHELKAEVVTRAAIIKSGIKSIRKVISSPKLTLKRKLTYVKAHLFAGGMFQCSTWGVLPPSLYFKMHHAVLSVYRVATANVFSSSVVDSMFSDADVIF